MFVCLFVVAIFHFPQTVESKFSSEKQGSNSRVKFNIVAVHKLNYTDYWRKCFGRVCGGGGRWHLPILCVGGLTLYAFTAFDSGIELDNYVAMRANLRI